jgi:hypothetical protein
MSPLETFQNQFGRDWAELVGTPAFSAALALAHSERIQKITILTDDEIAMRGQIILADLRGHLLYESALLGLHEKKEFVFQSLGEEEYPDPIKEAREENIIAQQEESQSTSVAGPSIHEQIFPEPKPKRRGRPPGKSKKKK